MNSVYLVFAADSGYEQSCVGAFTTNNEAEKCLEWWEECGDWNYYYIKQCDLHSKFYEELYDLAD